MQLAIGNRIVSDLVIPCPMGSPIGETLGGSGCRCTVEQTSIISAFDPSSLGRFCTSEDGHRRCPTFQREVERVREARKVELLDELHPQEIEAQGHEELQAELAERGVRVWTPGDARATAALLHEQLLRRMGG